MLSAYRKGPFQRSSRSRFLFITSVFLMYQFAAPLLGSSGLSALAEGRRYSSLSITGAEAHALLQAYALRSPGDRPIDAPFVLEADSIEILDSGGQITVGVFANRSKKSIAIVVKDGQVVSQTNVAFALTAEPKLLPGVTAGAIIAAYSDAIKRNDLVASSWKGRPFTVDVLVGAGGALVSFVPEQPVIAPGYKCLAGNCDNRSNYLVRIETGDTVVTPRT